MIVKYEQVIWSALRSDLRVICDNVHTAKLLHKHDEECALSSATVAADTEKLFPWVAANSFRGFDLEQLVRVVHVARSLDLVLTKAAKRLEGLFEPALLHIPSRGLRAKVYLDADDEGRDTSATQHPPPGRKSTKESYVLERDRDNEAQHDTEGGPHLPHHSQSTTNVFRRGLCGVYWCGGGFGTNCKTEEEPSDKQVVPTVRGSHPDTGDERDDARDEDSSATTEVFVQWSVGPASDGSGAEIWSAIEKALKPNIVDTELFEIEDLVKGQTIEANEGMQEKHTWAPLTAV